MFVHDPAYYGASISGICSIVHTRALVHLDLGDGKRVRLPGQGSHVCDMRSLRIANQTFEWDVDLDVPVANITPQSDHLNSPPST
jgi:hypothetical protein